MYRSKSFVCGGAVACLAFVTACSSSPALTPTPSTGTATTSNSDGSILKVTAPTPTAPANSSTFAKGVRASTLTATAATAPFGSIALTHHFQLFKAGALVVDAPNQAANGSTVTMATGDLDFSTTYTWRVRAESNNVPGPWSSTQSFTTGEVVQPRRDANAFGGKIPRSVIIEDLNATVFSVGAQHPGAVQASCLGTRNDISFPIEMLFVLRTQYDNRWGFNCIRGNCNDPAAKVITYHWSPGPSEGSTDVYIFQIISGACNLEVFDETAITFGSGTIGRYSLLPGSPFLMGASFTNLLDY
ncbi:MAG TPA: hypothetical protein VGJ29_05335 [Vicinamibacterales bacterium]